MRTGSTFNASIAFSLVLHLSFVVRSSGAEATAQKRDTQFGWDLKHNEGAHLTPLTNSAQRKHLVYKDNFAESAVDSTARELGDEDWSITRQEGYPLISFSNTTADQEVMFKYNTPLLYEGKTFEVAVFESDCETTAASGAITSTPDGSVDRELTVLLDIDQGTITDSEYYTSVNNTIAAINLCLRVEFFLGSRSVNFHETTVTMSVDLRAGLELTRISNMQILPTVGYPQIAVDADTGEGEIVFKYSAPPMNDATTFVTTVFEADCETISASSAISSTADTSVARELSVDLNIDAGLIGSSHYFVPSTENSTYGTLGFCLRVDFVATTGSRRLQTANETDIVSSYVTTVETEVDLTNGLDLVNITDVEGSSPTAMEGSIIQFEVDVSFDLPVLAFHCNASGSELTTQPELSQGDALQFCIEMDPLYNGGSYYVADIFSAELGQQQEDLTVMYSEFIGGGVSDLLTEKVCQGGICNIKTQLSSKWFNDSTPALLNTTGIALMAFGIPSNSARQRFLKVPITFQHPTQPEHTRRLVEGAYFVIATPLVKAASQGVTPAGASGHLIVMVSVTVVCVGAVFLSFQWRRQHIRRKNKQQELPFPTSKLSDTENATDAVAQTWQSSRSKSFDGNDDGPVQHPPAPTRSNSFEGFHKTDPSKQCLRSPSFDQDIEDIPSHAYSLPVHVAPNRSPIRSQSCEGYDDGLVQCLPGVTRSNSLDGFVASDPSEKCLRYLPYDVDIVPVENSLAPTRSFVVPLKKARPRKVLQSPSFEGADITARHPPTETRTFVAPLNEGPSRVSRRSQSFDGTNEVPVCQPPGTLRTFVAPLHDPPARRPRSSRTASAGGPSVHGRRPPPPSRSLEGHFKTATPDALSDQRPPSSSKSFEGYQSEMAPGTVFARRPPPPSRSFEGYHNTTAPVPSHRSESPLMHIPDASTTSRPTAPQLKRARSVHKKLLVDSPGDPLAGRPPHPMESFDGPRTVTPLMPQGSRRSRSTESSDEVPVQRPPAPARSFDGVLSRDPPRRSRKTRGISMEEAEETPVRRHPAPSRSFEGYLS